MPWARRPPLLVGIAVAAEAGVALTTLLVYTLDDVTRVLSLGVESTCSPSSSWRRSRACRWSIATAISRSAPASDSFHVEHNQPLANRRRRGSVGTRRLLHATITTSTRSPTGPAPAHAGGRRAPSRGDLSRRGGAAAPAPQSDSKRSTAAGLTHRLPAGARPLPTQAIELKADDSRRAHHRLPSARGRHASRHRWCSPRARTRPVPQARAGFASRRPLEALLAAALERDAPAGPGRRDRRAQTQQHDRDHAAARRLPRCCAHR